MNVKLISLKIKLKSLAEEARIIRKEERKLVQSGRGPETGYLSSHRKQVVRHAARSTHVAYGYIRGRTYQELEVSAKTEPDWDAIAKMVTKYSHKVDHSDMILWSKDPKLVCKQAS